MSREHIDCCASIPPALLGEFESLKGVVAAAQVEVYGASISYEHGRTGSCTSDPSAEPHCFHAHLHCVPIRFPIVDRIGTEYRMERLSGWLELVRRYAVQPDPYLLASDDVGLAFADAPGNVRRQYLRSLVAEEVGAPHLADWVAFQGRDRIEAAKLTLASVIRRIAADALR